MNFEYTVASETVPHYYSSHGDSEVVVEMCEILDPNGNTICFTRPEDVDVLLSHLNRSKYEHA